MKYGKDEKIMVSWINGCLGDPALGGNGHACFCKGDFIEGRRICPLDLHHHWSNYRPSPADPAAILFFSFIGTSSGMVLKKKKAAEEAEEKVVLPEYKPATAEK